MYGLLFRLPRNEHSFAELTQSQESGPMFGYEIFTSLVLSADFLPILLVSFKEVIGKNKSIK